MNYWPRLPESQNPFLIPLLGPAIFLIHDLEEIWTIENWTKANLNQVPTLVRSFLPIQTLEFAISVALIFACFLAIAVFDCRRLKKNQAPVLSLWATALLLSNALTHILQTIWFQGYTPGAITVVMLVIPYAYWVMKFSFAQGWIRRRANVARMLFVSFFAQSLLAGSFLILGRWVVLLLSL